MNKLAMAIIGSTMITAMAEVANVSVVGDWSLKVSFNGKEGIVEVPKSQIYTCKNEIIKLKDYNPNTGGWLRGSRPANIIAHECTTRFLILPESVVVNENEKEDSVVYEDGKDYKLTPDWGTVGRLPDGRIKPEQPVYITYKYCLRRLDSIVMTKDGKFAFKPCFPHVATPAEPVLEDGEVRIANIWLDGNVQKLDVDKNVFVLQEKAFPEPPAKKISTAQCLIPKTWQKLQNGEKVRILAWGDSVTVGTFLPEPSRQRWQMQFLDRLRSRFPNAEIEMLTEAWGGRNTQSFFDVPAGEEHNYKEKVLAVKPDLFVTEFVNDSSCDTDTTYQRYGRILQDFRALGAEWIILTPHYIRPDWMGLSSEKNVDEDPREYVKALRKFAEKNDIALADASLRYGRLWRRGIPASSLMVNSINHPNAFGMSLFADALMQLFQ